MNTPPRGRRHVHRWKQIAQTSSHLGELTVSGCMVDGCPKLRARYDDGRLSNEEAGFSADGGSDLG